MQEIIRELLAQLGENPSREGLVDTPKRVEKALRFLTSGYTADIDTVLNNALFTVDYNEMVIVKDIDFYSLCEHHLLPFFGKCHIAYIPRGKVIGLSKIPRLVEVFARRLQLQERLTSQIAETIKAKIQPAWRRGRRRRHAPLHVDAWRRETELVRHHQRDARCVSERRADARRIPRADSPPGAAGTRRRTRSIISSTAEPRVRTGYRSGANDRRQNVVQPAARRRSAMPVLVAGCRST